MPLTIETGKHKIKKHSIGMNWYRNAHFQVSNQVKKKYQDLVSEQLKEHRFKNYAKVKLYFTYYKKSNRKTDRANFCSIHEKFFCDAIVSMGIIKDDHDGIVKESHYYGDVVDKIDPRMEIEIHVIE